MTIEDILRKENDDVIQSIYNHPFMRGIAERVKMKDVFRKCCQLEYGFWEMAFTCGNWPSKERVDMI